MSLLLDALKRAEQEKSGRDPGEGLALVDDVPAKEAASDSPAASASSVTDNDARAAAKGLFTAKQGGLGEAVPVAGRRKAVIAGIVLGTLVLVAIGGVYVWLETGGGVPLAKSPTRPALVGQAPAPSPAKPAPAPVATTPPAGTAISPAGEGVSKAGLPTSGNAKPPARTPAQRVASAAQPEPNAPARFMRETNAPAVPPKVGAGYEALRAGNIEQAQTLYLEALATDPANVDAHLGLAAASARAGDRAMAERHYREALDLNPGNASAIAGLAALADFTRADALEAQLRADVSRFPSSAALRFTLGGLYAAQSRWNEAQAAYFEAYRLEPDNPDLAFNLAVSLDQLGQRRLAADFYERALNGAKSRGGQFDPAQALRRLADIRR